jgi:hypothetical protein
MSTSLSAVIFVDIGPLQAVVVYSIAAILVGLLGWLAAGAVRRALGR